MITLRPKAWLYWFYQFANIFVLSLTIWFIFYIVLNKMTIYYWGIILCPFALYYTIKEEIYYFSIKIHLAEDYIFVPGAKQDKNIKIQYETKFNYNEIDKLEIIGCYTNSKNQSFKSSLAYYVLVPKKYLQITLTNGKIKRIWLDLYTKKQTLKILNKINTKIKIDTNKIMEKWYSTHGQYKKILKNSETNKS